MFIILEVHVLNRTTRGQYRDAWIEGRAKKRKHNQTCLNPCGLL